MYVVVPVSNLSINSLKCFLRCSEIKFDKKNLLSINNIEQFGKMLHIIQKHLVPSQGVHESIVMQCHNIQ